MTNPSRSLSQGLLAVAGSVLRLLSALQAMKPPMPEGMTAASAEPGGAGQAQTGTVHGPGNWCSTKVTRTKGKIVQTQLHWQPAVLY